MAPTRSTIELRSEKIPKPSKSIKVSKEQYLDFDDRLCRATSNFTNREINILKDHYLNNSKYATKKERMDWAIEFTKNGGDVFQKRKSIMDWFFQRRKRDKQMQAARDRQETGNSVQKMKKNEAVPHLDSSEKQLKNTPQQMKIRQKEMKKKEEAKKKLEAPKRKLIKLDVLTQEDEEDLLNHYNSSKTVTLENMKSWSQDLGISIYTVVDWMMNQKPLEELDEVMDDVMEDLEDAKEDPNTDANPDEMMEDPEDAMKDPEDDENPDIVLEDSEDAIKDTEDNVNLDDMMEDPKDAIEDPEDAVTVEVEEEQILELEKEEEDPADDVNPDDVMEDPKDAIEAPEDDVIVEVEEEEVLEVTEKEQDKENHIPVEVENDDCLLLRNRRTDCFMNTIANLLYSCQGVRSIICNPDLYREGSKLANILLELFWKQSNSTRKWRETLQNDKYHSKHQDVGEVFEFLIEDLCKDINLFPMKFKTLTEKECDKCGDLDFSTTIQHFSILKQTRHETFSNLLTEEYAPQLVSKCYCGGNVVEERKITPIGSYHFMIVQHEFAKFRDLKSDDTFKMFGCSWRIRSFAEYLPARTEYKGEKGHFVTWINTGVDWMCVNDNDNRMRKKELNLSEMDVNLIVFERSCNV